MSGLYLGRQMSLPAVRMTSGISDMPAEASGPNDLTESMGPTEEPVSFPVDINTAGLRELMELPDIGEVLAQRIIDHRTEHGPFEKTEEIMEVYGISDKRYEKIKDLICIGGE